MSINNPNFQPPAERRVEDSQKELLRKPKTTNMAGTGTVHVSTFQVTKTLGRQIARAPAVASLGTKQLTPQQLSNLSALHKKEIQKAPISLTTSSQIAPTTSISNIIPVQISGSSAAAMVHVSPAPHVNNVSPIYRPAVPGGVTHPTPPFSHLPRGLVAAQSVRAGQTVSVHRQTLPTSIHLSSHTATHPHSLPSQIRNVMPQSIRPGTPPTNRSISPVISIGTAQPVDSHRTNISLHNATTVSNTPSIQITLQASRTASEGIKPTTTFQPGKVNVNPGLNMTAQSKVVMTPPLTQVLQHQTLAAKGNRGQPVGTTPTPMSTVTMALSTSTVTIPILSTGTTSTIPIAKVPPQRQLPSGIHSTLTTIPTETRGSEPQTFTQPAPAHSQSTTQAAHIVPQAQSQPATSLFIPQPRGAPIITTGTSIASSSETRDPHPGMPFFPPYMLSPDNPYYQQLMRCQVAAVAQQQSRTSIMTSQSPVSLAASLQGSLAGNQPSVTRLNHPLMVMQDSLRQTAPQTTQTAHAQFHSSGTEGLTKISNANTDSVTPLNVPTPMQVSGISVAAVYPASTHNSLVSQIMQQAAGHQATSGGGPSSTPVVNPSASPRPSILRKRTNEGISTVKKQLALTSVPEVHSPRPEPRPESTPQSNMSSPKTPASGESQSSTDTALSSEATTPTLLVQDKIKHEPPEHLENGYANSNTPEISPRKRRKQLLQATEEIRDAPVNVFDKLVEACVKEEEEDDDFDDDDYLDDTLTDDETPDIKEEFIDDDGIRWTVEKCRSGVTLLNFYNISWKPKNNHFVRYSDVKAKDERRPSVNELSNQKGVIQKASGWKLYHMAAQIEDLVALEKDLNEKLSELQSVISPSPPSRHSILEDESVMLHELTQGNIQRCKLINDQLAEAKSSMLKVLDHKPKISEIISKHMSKRPIKKKERT